MKIILQNCDPSVADDRSLPYTSYLVTYMIDGKVTYDLVVTNKKVDIFDHYWDRYRHDFVTFTQTEGRMNPKLWQDPNQKKRK